MKIHFFRIGSFLQVVLFMIINTYFHQLGLRSGEVPTRTSPIYFTLLITVVIVLYSVSNLVNCRKYGYD